MSERCLCEWLSGLEESGLLELEAVFRKDSHIYWRRQEALRNGCLMPEGRKASEDELRKAWQAVHGFREAFERLNLNSREHRRQAGGSAGDGEQQITLEKERGYDYRRFLKRFAVEREELSLDQDSFDYIPYDYSRKMYERLVFLEPLEYREMQKLEEFVIAIDTSGSCSGEVLRQFLQ